MQWVIENWILVLVGGGMLAMHLFGHGHGHKGGHKKGDHGSDKNHEAPGRQTAVEAEESSNG